MIWRKKEKIGHVHNEFQSGRGEGTQTCKYYMCIRYHLVAIFLVKDGLVDNRLELGLVAALLQHESTGRKRIEWDECTVAKRKTS